MAKTKAAREQDKKQAGAWGETPTLKEKRAAKSKTKEKAKGKKAKPESKKEVKKKPTVIEMKPVKSDEVIYPKIDTQLFLTNDRPSTYKDVQPMTHELARDLLGWVEETETEVFGEDVLPLFVNPYTGFGVCLTNNRLNRPFYMNLAQDWQFEILRKKWTFNGEPWIFDKQGCQHDGQHRGVGLVLAYFEWLEDQKRPEGEQLWQENWPDGPPVMDALVVMGIDAADADTIGRGKRRSNNDILYRSKFVSHIVKPDEKRRFSKILSWAVAMLWQRTSQKLSAKERYGDKFGNRWPASEILDFIERHKRIVDCANFIVKLNKAAEAEAAKYEEGKSPKGLLQYLALGHASALLYLMASSDSDPSNMENPNRYDIVLNESALDFGKWKMACSFWTKLCDNAPELEGLTDMLIEHGQRLDMTPGHKINLICGMIVKAWNLVVDKKPVTAEDVLVEEKPNEFERMEIVENPMCGGIDAGAGYGT